MYRLAPRCVSKFYIAIIFVVNYSLFSVFEFFTKPVKREAVIINSNVLNTQFMNGLPALSGWLEAVSAGAWAIFKALSPS